ncbi:type IX secretion system protein PorG [Chitinophaga parva]|nr:DUF6089 family protein [Chitinophaga parva]
MKKFPLLLLLLIMMSGATYAQYWQGGIFLGAANYSGDLVQKRVDFRYTGIAAGLLIKRDFNPHFTLRASLTYGRVSGADSTNTAKDLVARNLSFRSPIWEGAVIAEGNLLDIDDKGFTPYAFAGIGLFSFYPSTRMANGNWVSLRRYSTEGEGLPQYPDRSMYNLVSVSIPFGVGFKWNVTDHIQMGIEVGLRKTFTDYIDDVSKGYVDQNTLILERGTTAAKLAYRGDELTKNGTPGTYPPDGFPRGNPKQKDWYSFSGLTVTYRFGGGGSGRWGKQKVSTCPKF